jgi:hypothetical protein
LAEGAMLGACDEQGQCKPKPELCPMVKGEVHFTCDTVCVSNPQACQPLAPAADVDMNAMCPDGQSPNCHPVCANEAIQIYECLGGVCTNLGQDLCVPYVCDPLIVECLVACEGQMDCADGYFCFDFDCVMG